MKRTLLLASFLGLGFALYAQNNGAANNANPRPETRAPNARVRVTPGPQGLPIVDSSASAWPLGPAPGESLDYWLNGALQTGEGGEPAGPPVSPASQPRTTDQTKPSFEPPPPGGPSSFSPTRSGGQSSSAMGPDLVSQGPRQSGQSSGQPSGGNAPSGGGKVIVVPSPVHYDRAGRRVVDPGWQESMYRMIQAEKQAASPAPREAGAEQNGQTAERNRTPGAAPDEPPVRETVIVVPGPAIWRIRGTLTAARGMLALEDKEGVLWYLPGLDRYIGFIDGLNAGEEAAMEGYAPPQGSSQERYFQPVRLFIDEMAYDLTIPPYGIAVPGIGIPAPGGQTTVIRETERRGGNQNPAERRVRGGERGGTAPESRRGGDYNEDGWYLDDWDDPPSRNRNKRERSRREPAARPVWEHNHKSPWAPPPSVLEFEMDYDSFWRDDPAKQKRRERDSREIWY